MRTVSCCFTALTCDYNLLGMYFLVRNSEHHCKNQLYWGLLLVHFSKTQIFLKHWTLSFFEYLQFLNFMQPIMKDKRTVPRYTV